MKNSIEPEFKTYIVPREINQVIVAGVGGTGSYYADGLAKLVSGYKLPIGITLVDFDMVEEGNTSRQNFHHCEVGLNKAESLSARLKVDIGEYALDLNGRWGLDIATYNGTIEGYLASRHIDGRSTLLVSCLDKVSPRKHIKDFPNMIDLGNGLDYGQAVYGTENRVTYIRKELSRWSKTPHVSALPSAYIKNGLKRVFDSKKDEAVTCRNIPFDEQGCFINQWSAMAGLNITHQILIGGEVRTPAIYFNFKEARMIPCKITKEYLTV